MNDSVTFLDALVEALGAAGSYNKSDQVPPAVVLWPDRDRSWEPLLPLLRQRLPVLTLGEYSPADRRGPAYWIRCMIARTLTWDVLPEGAVPVVYMPGVSRQDIRAIEDCPKALQPLAELQYRGVLWTHKNGRDWTVAGFLQSADGGLGIQVAGNGATREALQRALVKLAEEPLASLRKQEPLRAAFFDLLLNPDDARSLLLWLSDPGGFRKARTKAEWEAFASLCAMKYGFQPDQDGEIAAAKLLGRRDGPWDRAWRRFAESPASYRGLPELLRRARPNAPVDMFYSAEEWPQDNESAEESLRQALLAIGDRHSTEARKAIAQLEEEHGRRRAWIWAELGKSPLARALEHLVALANATEHTVVGATTEEIAQAYAAGGWRADSETLAALAEVEIKDDVKAVQEAVLSVYRAWLETGADALQKAVAAGDPARAYPFRPLGDIEGGTCLLFSDGLRFDLGQRLASLLAERRVDCGVEWRLAALPTVTSTAKPAVAPIAAAVSGGAGLDPVVHAAGTSVDVEVLRNLLDAAGYQVLRGEETGDPSGRAWTELGDVDSYGHDHGWKIAHQAPVEIRALARRVVELLEAGWKRVVVVTDHGWLMLPGGLPKANLPEHLTEVRKGRCARLKEGAQTDERCVPWHWDSEVRIATPRGIRCYEAGRECEHGGISPQECVIPVIRATWSQQVPRPSVAIESVAWRGLRCSVKVIGAPAGAVIDLRTKAADWGTSLVGGAKAPDAEGKASILVADEDRTGEDTLLVVLGPDGDLLAQVPTKVGG